MEMRFVLLLFLFFGLSFGFDQLVAQNNPNKKVAILEVVDKEGKLGYPVKLMLRSNLMAAVTNTPGYEGYDRVDISQIVGEQNFQRTGMVSDAQIKKLGEMTGAAYILVAEAARLSENDLFIVAKILEVESGKVEQTANIQTKTEEFEKACRQLAVDLFASSSRGDGMPSLPAGGGEEFIETVFGINMKMVYVPGGDFLMGGTSEQGEEATTFEKPIRRVTLSPYYIGTFEVTQSQWEKTMGTNPSGFKKGGDYPVVNVSWEDARAFCQELSRKTGKTYVLPTEAQWEYAARGGSQSEKTKYSGSWSIDAVAWYGENSGQGTHPVGSKRPNVLGLYDMSGNVFEWCQDWFAAYQTHDIQNPVGASTGSRRVLRGGSWYDYDRGCRVSYRSSNMPSLRNAYNGFRVVLFP